MGRHNIIELNGKQYDALTGALLGESKITATPATKAAHLKRQGRVVDGFFGRKPTTNVKPTVVKPSYIPKKNALHAETTTMKSFSYASTTSKAPAAVQTAQKVMGDVKRIRPTRVHSLKKPGVRQPEKSKTLMRHVVKKPSVHKKPTIKTTVPSEMMARPKSTLAKPLEKKLSVSQVNPLRLGRAQRIPKSQHIHRFSRERPTQSAAAAVPTVTPYATLSASLRPDLERSKPYATQTAQRPYAYTGSRPATARPTHTKSAMPQGAAANTVPAAKTAAATPKPHADIFEAALAHATSHEQKPIQPRKHTLRRKRFVSLMAGLGAFLLIAGFIAYLNKPAIELRVASMRAGFHAQMPSYKPTGYALEGSVQTNEDMVAMEFRSGENSYRITQKASDWNSSTLLDQTAAERGVPTRTIQSKGRTIYIYNDSSATWVNGGVHYEITGNSTMGPGELVSLATSL